MIKKYKNNIYYSDRFKNIPHLIYGFTDKNSGDMLNPEIRSAFTVKLGFKPNQIVWPEQIHGNQIKIIQKIDLSGQVAGVDGLVWKRTGNDQALLLVHVADCVPILAVDPQAQILAAVHSGWKGTLTEIIAVTINNMRRLGAEIKNIHIFIGPSIGRCCYDVPAGRAAKFREKFSSNTVENRNGKDYLDLVSANLEMLNKMGIPDNHIDIANICTSTNHQDFFSYRYEKGKNQGEFIGFIGYHN